MRPPDTEALKVRTSYGTREIKLMLTIERIVILIGILLVVFVCVFPPRSHGNWGSQPYYTNPITRYTYNRVVLRGTPDYKSVSLELVGIVLSTLGAVYLTKTGRKL